MNLDMTRTVSLLLMVLLLQLGIAQDASSQVLPPTDPTPDPPGEVNPRPPGAPPAPVPGSTGPPTCVAGPGSSTIPGAFIYDGGGAEDIN